MIYAAWSIMSEGESNAYQSNLNLEGLMRTDLKAENGQMLLTIDWDITIDVKSTCNFSKNSNIWFIDFKLEICVKNIKQFFFNFLTNKIGNS